MTDKQKNLVTRAITGVLFVGVMVAGFMAPHYMIVLFAVITGMTLWEYTGLVSQIEGVSVNRFISVVAGVYFFVAMAGLRLGYVKDFSVFVPYILTIVYLIIAELYLKNENPINNWAYTMLGQMYIALPFSMINVLAFQHDANGNIMADMLLPLSIFIFLWTNDTGSNCSGSLYCRHKLIPRISPAKSWEGSIGGGTLVLFAAFLVSILDQSYGNLSGLNTLQWRGLGLVVTVFGTWGDLVESLIKRTLGIKDSGTILPGHGGMLDRFDSSLLAIPASAVYIYTIQTLV